MSKAIVKVGDEVNAQDFSKALSDAFERVEQAPKPKRKKKKGKKLAKKVVADDRALMHNPAFDVGVLVESGRTSTKNPNIANPPRSGDIAIRKSVRGGSATGIFIGNVWDTEDPSLSIGFEVKGGPNLTWAATVFGKKVL